MKKLIIIPILIFTSFGLCCKAKDNSDPEKYGNTLNIGIGVGYFGYVGHALPIGVVNYEFDVARNFTLAPFIAGYSYQNYYYWGNPDKPFYDPSYRQYSYRETVIPVGAKGTYYFDELFRAGDRWDFYAAASLGFVFRSVTWESGYYGDRRVYQSGSTLYLSAHIGTELHLNRKLGLFLDLSSDVSTFGLAVHF